MINLKNIIERECARATMHKSHAFAVVTLASAQKVTKPNAEFRITKQGPDKFLLESVTTMPNATTTVDLGPVYAYAGVITGTAFAKTQYGNVVDDPMFHKLYDVQQRPLNYIEGGAALTRPTLSAPCMICGLVLPLRNLTIDHQRPQTGGDHEAVLKTFRAFGLTTEGPQGPKGRAILAHITQGTPVATVPTQPTRAALGGALPVNRYTLNDIGTILYSFVASAGETALLESQCMHGLLNLKPACGACNSARGNPLKF